jgi:gamma-glutamyl hydrolase
MKFELILLACLLNAFAFATQRPIIGVLTTPLLSSGCITVAANGDGDGLGSCFHQIYVNWLYEGGARVVPIPYDLPRDKIDHLLKSINGVLFTGGELMLELNTTYGHTAGYILEKVIEFNEKDKVHYPLWGTCMGMQLLSALVAEDASVIAKSRFDSEGIGRSLTLTPRAYQSRMFRDIPKSILHDLQTKPITSNLHHDGVYPETYAKNRKLRDFFHVLSTNIDLKGNPFVSTVEGKRYPVYAVQWHPERPQFDWSQEDYIPHSPIAFPAMQYFAQFLVSEARKNNNKFGSLDEEQSNLIFNFQARYTGENLVAYFFPPSL